MTATSTGCGWAPGASAGGALHPALLDAWDSAAAMGEGVVIALLVVTEGPAYRNIGAAMAIAADGRCAGAISSGCIEAELIRQAEEVRATGTPKRLRYGEGSPFFDLRLPCGGALEVLVFALRDPAVIAELAQRRAARQPVSLLVSPDGRLSLGAYAPTRGGQAGFSLGFRPPLRCLILGSGAEALTFARLLAGLGYEHLLLAHDEATLASAQALGAQARKLPLRLEAEALEIDADTAIVLFYHDHDREPELLRPLLASDAFYIGAQGSRRAQHARLVRLREMGVPEARLARLRGPIGLIPSTRDAQMLAVSVLAEIMSVARAREEAAAPAAIEAVG